MKKESYPVEPLKKVLLKITPGTCPDSKDSLSVTETMEFIFGIGVEGLTPLERAIDGKRMADEFVVKVHKTELKEFFGHLMRCELLQGDDDQCYLHIRIQDVSEALPREIVREMAAGAGCGAGCDCGCSSH